MIGTKKEEPTNPGVGFITGAGAVMSQPAVLQEILKFHILPPEPVRRGLWTTPFMRCGGMQWRATLVLHCASLCIMIKDAAAPLCR